MTVTPDENSRRLDRLEITMQSHQEKVLREITVLKDESKSAQIQLGLIDGKLDGLSGRIDLSRELVDTVKQMSRERQEDSERDADRSFDREKLMWRVLGILLLLTFGADAVGLINVLP